jgi:tetratricopeptide (TPR) repeat protein
MSKGPQKKIEIPSHWWTKLVEELRSRGFETVEQLCERRPGFLTARTIKNAQKPPSEMTEASFRQLARLLGYTHSQDLIDAWGKAAEPKSGAEPPSDTPNLGKTPAIPQAIRAAISRGVDFFNTGHFNEAKNEFQQAVTEAERVGHGLGIVDAKEHLALVLTHLDRDTAGAKALLSECLDILATEDNDKERAEVLQRLAGVHEQEGNLELSESLQRQSLGISEKLGDKQGHAAALVGLGWTIGRGGRTGEALQLNRTAYELLTQVLHEVKQGDTRRIGFIHTILGNLFFQRAKVHQRRAEPDEAEKALGEALEWQRKVPPNHELAKLLRELAELKFFRRKLDEGVGLLQQAATLYQERAMLPEFAECLHIMGRVHASVGNFQKAGEFFSGAASAAVDSGRNQQAAEMLLTLAHLAMKQQDMNAAREFLENAKSASTEGDFQAKCVMELSRLAAKQGDAEERQRLVEEAVNLLKTNLATKKPAPERAKQYFMLGWYLREAGQLEEALSSVRKAHERFELAGDAFGAAKASFEAAGLLDHMSRKKEARELCLTLLQIVERKPFFEIAAGVNLSLARFAFHDDKDSRGEPLSG